MFFPCFARSLLPPPFLLPAVPAMPSPTTTLYASLLEAAITSAAAAFLVLQQTVDWRLQLHYTHQTGLFLVLFFSLVFPAEPQAE